MEWRDEAFVLGARPHGENAAVVQLLTRIHGRHAGLLYGGASHARRPLVEPGNRVDATWRARLADHLGRFTIEATHHHAAAMMDDAARLAALSAACAIIEIVVPEREPHPALFDATEALMQTLSQGTDGVWQAVYVHWELGLLRELGFGLRLDSCAVTGGSEDLVWVSPRTGRAVSRAAGAPYAGRLLGLPAFLRPGGRGADIAPADLVAGLALTGHFLARHAFDPLDKPLPAPRSRLEAILSRAAGEVDPPAAEGPDEP